MTDSARIVDDLKSKIADTEVILDHLAHDAEELREAVIGGYRSDLITGNGHAKPENDEASPREQSETIKS